MFLVKLVRGGAMGAVLLMSTGACTAQTIAVTMDDLPYMGDLPEGMSRMEIASKIIDAFHHADAPPIYGFVNASLIEKQPDTAEVLERWVDADNLLGNHTWSHKSMSYMPLEGFYKEVTDDEPALKKYSKADADWHWLRYPGLGEGNTIERRHSVEKWLAGHHYRVAEVTIDTQDYNWNPPLARCTAEHDREAIEWLKQSYLTNVSDAIDQAQQMAKMLYGHEIPQVMLIHIGAIEAMMLPRVLEMLKQKGLRLVTLPEAESDPAYDRTAMMDVTGGNTMLLLQMNTRHLKVPPRDHDFKAQLKDLCAEPVRP